MKTTNGKRRKRHAPWTKEHIKELKGHLRAKTPVVKISNAIKRTMGALRQKVPLLNLRWVWWVR